MSVTDRGDGHPTLNVASRPQVGMMTFFREAFGYAFKFSFRLHAKDAIHQNYEGVEVTLLLKERL